MIEEETTAFKKSGDLALRLNLYQVSEYEKYRKFLDTTNVKENYPIFIIGQPIEGKVIIESHKEGKISCKSLMVKFRNLIYIYHSGTQKQKIKEKASPILTDNKIDVLIKYSHEIQFIPPTSLGVSYFSDTFNKIFQIKAVLKTGFSTTTVVSQKVILINPISPSLTKPFSMFIEEKDYKAKLSFNKSEYSITDEINGTIIIERNDTCDDSIDQCYISFVASEAAGNETKDQSFCKYQLTDGLPKSGTKSKFSLQLSKMHLWAYTTPCDSLFKVTYKFEFNVAKKVIKKDSKQIIIKEVHPVQLYLKSLQQ
ncbi:hypothetical protein GPJ56_008753 [Histomonas meleagridis]|uniref:uncharacterized protein n=1 Tax=Histomonas meleagridis TaxID=135588 RepID=UPI00355969CC|nr:hypothetical protein GPJ56_008753 [Histomonas meleagridis]KAH0805454.1 hypothetical protein GO595_001836 [Histomonas meleagridis]